MNNRDWQKRFDEKFVDRKVKQVDSSNSIVIYPWKHPHSHQSQQVKAFIQAELTTQRTQLSEEVENMPVFKVLADNGNNQEFVFKKDVLAALKKGTE